MTSRTGTNGEPGTGFGMPLVEQWILVLNGNMNITSKVQEECKTGEKPGTTVTVSIPMSKDMGLRKTA